MGIYDTELGGWTAKQVNKKEQGHPEGRDIVMKQIQVEKATRHKQSGQ